MRVQQIAVLCTIHVEPGIGLVKAAFITLFKIHSRLNVAVLHTKLIAIRIEGRCIKQHVPDRPTLYLHSQLRRAPARNGRRSFLGAERKAQIKITIALKSRHGLQASSWNMVC